MPWQSGSSKSTQLLHLLMWEKEQGSKSVCPPCQARAWPCRMTVPFRVKVKGPADWKMSLIQAMLYKKKFQFLLLSGLRDWLSLGHLDLSIRCPVSLCPVCPVAFHRQLHSLVSLVSLEGGQSGKKKKWECPRAEILLKFLVVRNMSSIEWFWKRSRKGSTLKAFVD